MRNTGRRRSRDDEDGSYVLKQSPGKVGLGKDTESPCRGLQETRGPGLQEGWGGPCQERTKGPRGRLCCPVSSEYLLDPVLCTQDLVQRKGEQEREERVHFVGLDTQARVGDAGAEQCGGWCHSRKKASLGWRPSFLLPPPPLPPTPSWSHGIVLPRTASQVHTLSLLSHVVSSFPSC